MEEARNKLAQTTTEQQQQQQHQQEFDITTVGPETVQIHSDAPTFETTTTESVRHLDSSSPTPPFISDNEEFDFGKVEASSEPSRNLSDILFNKARARPQNFQDVTDGLAVPPNFDGKPEMTPTPHFTSPEVPIFEESSENSTEPEVYKNVYFSVSIRIGYES